MIGVRLSYRFFSLPSIDKGKHGFDGQKCAHTASSPLAIRQVLPAGLFLSGHISAPTKLLTPASDVFSSDFWLLRRRLAGASQGEKGKKHRKDALSGVVALVNRWYNFYWTRRKNDDTAKLPRRGAGERLMRDKSSAAAAAATVTAAAAVVAPAAVAAEQEQQDDGNDDPAAAVTAKARILITHTVTSYENLTALWVSFS